MEKEALLSFDGKRHPKIRPAHIMKIMEGDPRRYEGSDHYKEHQKELVQTYRVDTEPGGDNGIIRCRPLPYAGKYGLPKEDHPHGKEEKPDRQYQKKEPEL